MTLENLERIGQIHSEAPDEAEFGSLVRAAKERLDDSQNQSLSYAGRFDLAYGAAHGLALAAMRASGFRSDKRYMVFQCLIHTTAATKEDVRLFTVCHEKRNLAEYEGHFERDEKLLTELIEITKRLSLLIDELKV